MQFLYENVCPIPVIKINILKMDLCLGGQRNNNRLQMKCLLLK